MRIRGPELCFLPALIDDLKSFGATDGRGNDGKKIIPFFRHQFLSGLQMNRAERSSHAQERPDHRRRSRIRDESSGLTRRGNPVGIYFPTHVYTPIRRNAVSPSDGTGAQPTVPDPRIRGRKPCRENAIGRKVECWIRASFRDCDSASLGESQVRGEALSEAFAEFRVAASPETISRDIGSDLADAGLDLPRLESYLKKLEDHTDDFFRYLTELSR